MKRVVLFLMGILLAFGAFAQTKSEMEMIQSLFGEQKALVVEHFVHPAPQYKAAFDKLYSQYETQRKVLGKERVELLNQYANHWTTMTNEQADAWMKKVLSLSKKRQKLLDTYYKKIKKQTDALTATRFYQVESYILTYIRFTILNNIPFVGE